MRIAVLAFLFISNLCWSYDYKDQLKELRSSVFDQISDLDAALEYANLRIRIAEMKNDKRAIAGSLFLKGYVYDEHGRSDDAIREYISSEMLYRELGVDEKRMSLLKNIGYNYNSLELYEQSYSFFEQAYYLAMKIDDKKYQADLSRYMSELSGKLKNVNDALTKISRAIHLYKEMSDTLGMAKSYIAKGLMYYQVGIEDSAISEYRKAFEIGNQVVKSKATNNMANAFIANKNYDSAEFYLNLSIVMNTQFDNKELLVENYNNLARIHFHKGIYDTSLLYTAKSIANNNKDNFKGLLTSYFYLDSLSTSGKVKIDEGIKDLVENRFKRGLVDVESSLNYYQVYIRLLTDFHQEEIRRKDNVISAVSYGSTAIVFLILMVGFIKNKGNRGGGNPKMQKRLDDIYRDS